MTTKTIEMLYDTYECDFGDGFYPLLKSKNERDNFGLIPIQIIFKMEHSIWKQQNGPKQISGLDGETGPQLLLLLNDSDSLSSSSQIIYNLKNNQIYPKIKKWGKEWDKEWGKNDQKIK